MTLDAGPGGNRRDRLPLRFLPVVWTSLVLGGVISFGARALMARSLTMEAFGAISMVLAAVMILAPWAALGVASFWIQVYGEEGSTAHRWIPSSLRAVILAVAGASIALVLWASTVSDATGIVLLALWALPLLGLIVVTGLGMAQAQIEDDFTTVSMLQIATQSVLLVAAGVGYVAGWDAYELMRGIGVAATISLVAISGILLRFLWKQPQEQLPEPHSTEHQAMPSSFTAVIRRVWPFAVSGGLFAVFFQIDILLLGRMRGPSEVALYAVAVSLVGGMHLLPTALNRVLLLPRYQRWAHHDRDRLRNTYHRTTTILIAVAVAGAIALVAVSAWLIPVVFGESYSPAIPIVALLSLSIPLRAGASGAGAIMSTRENIKRKALLVVLATVVNITANLLLIPAWGVYGAAVGTVLAEGTLFLLYRLGTRRYLEQTPTAGRGR